MLALLKFAIYLPIYLFKHRNHRKLLGSMLVNYKNVDELECAHNAVSQLNIRDKEYLYDYALKYPAFYKEIINLFQDMNESGLYFIENKGLYESLILSGKFENKIKLDRLSSIKLLHKAGIHYENNKEVYNAILHTHNLTQAKIKVEALLVYKKNKMSNQNLWQEIIYGDHTKAALKIILLQADISFQENADCFGVFLKQVGKIDLVALSYAIKAMIKIGIDRKQYPEYFNAGILINHAYVISKILTQVEELNLNLNDHGWFIFKILNHLNMPSSSSSQEVLAVSTELTDFFQNGGDIQDINSLENILDKNLSFFDNLPRGPLNKSLSTIEIENILKKLAKPNEVKNFKGYFKAKNESYYLNYKGKKTNISALIKNANLSHLTLTPALVDHLGLTLESLIYPTFWRAAKVPVEVENLPFIYQVAFEIYTDYAYRNINALCRGEPLAYDRKYVEWLKDDTDKIVGNFLIACILHDGLNKLQHHALSIKEPLNLIRKEVLTQETINTRLVNPWTFPALTSFSFFLDGSPEVLINKESIKNIVENGRGVCINDHEAEILYPQGTQVFTRKLTDTQYLSTVFCSPAFSIRDNRFADLALQHAWTHHLVNRYVNEDNRYYLENGICIYRPNHGLAHTHRVMNLIDHVIHYFSQFANDEAFRNFCLFLDENQRTWLKIAVAFSVTGREGEVSFSEAPEQYKEYRLKSAENFRQFCLRHSALARQKKRLNSMTELVEFMGDPTYESQKSGETLFILQIISVARKIDLARCYDPQEYNKVVINYCQNLSIPTQAAKNELNGMIKYDIELMKVQGNALNSDMDAQGNMVEANRHYSPIFLEASRSIKRLEELCKLVPAPQIIPPFQLKADEFARAKRAL